MTGKRTRYSADFKAKVALEAQWGELTAAQTHTKLSMSIPVADMRPITRH
jgi:hypothetical protein